MTNQESSPFDDVASDEVRQLKDAIQDWEDQMILSGVPKDNFHSMLLAHVIASMIIQKGKAQTFTLFMGIVQEIVKVPEVKCK